MPIIQEKVIPDSIVNSDCWRGYNVLDISEFKHYRINHSKLFADKKIHINGIEYPHYAEADPIFGTRLSDICKHLTVYQEPIFHYF